MLFDLRSRGRRRTVQVIYIGLAVLIGAGLILFGAFTGSNSSSSNNAMTSQVKKAVALTKKSPSSAAAWASLVDARFSAANSVGFDSSTNTYTKAGKEQLQLLTQAYNRYVSIAKKPNITNATIAAKAYTQLSNWKTASSAYQTVLAGEPGNIHALECVALTSYAAKNTRVAELAQARVLAKLPKTVRKTTQTELEEAKTSTTIVTESC